MNRNRQILTRLQELGIAQRFPFLALPPELRLIVYDYSVNFHGVDKWFDSFWKILLESPKPSRAPAPVVYRHTPAVLLICKQIYYEAMELLRGQGMRFHHGLLDIDGLSNLMNTDILRNVSSLTIDATGHAIIPQKRNLIGPSWRGHLDMLVDISDILAKGHRLKQFTLNFKDTSIHAHVHDCSGKPIRCDFRDQLAEALRHLRNIRSVGTVNLVGFPPAMVAELKARMESPPTSLLTLPGEIRNIIWEMSADWSDISTQLMRTVDLWFKDDKSFRKTPPYPAVSTPTILLVNKQIHGEAKSVLYNKPLTLHMPVDERLTRTSETLNAIKFITAPTLAKVRVMEVHISSWEWVYALDRIVTALAASHNLKTFNFIFRDSLKGSFFHKGRTYPDSELHMALSQLAKIRGVPEVVFAGDLPDSYTAPLKMIMESDPVEGEVLPVLKGVKEENGIAKVVEISEDA